MFGGVSHGYRPKLLTPARLAWGLHIHEPEDLSPIWPLAQAGRLAGVTVINNIGLANALAPYVRYVVLRMCQTDHDDPVQDYQRYRADPRVLIQCGNEANVPNDTAHWLKQMRDADADGRKVVIFNDSVGWTADETWLERKPALQYAKAHGHYVGLHCYGVVTDGGDVYHPLTEPNGWRWFGGRVFHLYSLMPPEAQPDFIATEAGAGGFQLNATAAQWLADVRRMNTLVQDYPWFKSFHLWDFSKRGLGFDRDLINGYVHQLMA